MKKRIVLLLLIGLSFILGVSFGHYKYPPFYSIWEFKNFLVEDIFTRNNLNKFAECKLPILTQIDKNSHAFIGHAYGRSISNESSYLAPNVLNFITDEKHKLKSITFTGDVFQFPSLSKWKRLSRELASAKNIFIAPGNHDVGSLDYRDLFNLSIFGSRDYPFVEYLDEFPVVYDDSDSSKWLISNELLKKINTLSSKKIIIARHNIPTSDMLRLANSTEGMSLELKPVEELVKSFSKNRNYIWIIGDSGGSEKLPRISCLRYQNHTFISNGIGEISGDTILIYKGGEFYKYVL